MFVFERSAGAFDEHHGVGQPIGNRRLRDRPGNRAVEIIARVDDSRWLKHSVQIGSRRHNTVVEQGLDLAGRPIHLLRDGVIRHVKLLVPTRRFPRSVRTVKHRQVMPRRSKISRERRFVPVKTKIELRIERFLFQKRKDKRQDVVFQSRIARTLDPPFRRRKLIEQAEIMMDRQTELPHFVGADRSPGRSPSRLDGRKKKDKQQADDRQDDENFRERDSEATDGNRSLHAIARERKDEGRNTLDK